MDWSDDVAYSVHDVEDAVASGRVDLSALRSKSEMAVVIAVTQKLYASDLDEVELTEALARLLDTGWIPQSHNGSRTDLAALKDMTSLLIGRFVQSVGLATRAKYGDGPLTRFAAELVIPDEVRGEGAVPKGAAHGLQRLHDIRRYNVPATVIACEFPSSLLTEWIDASHPFTEELARIRDVEYVDLPTGHWPQFTKPVELGQAILAAVERAG